MQIEQSAGVDGTEQSSFLRMQIALISRGRELSMSQGVGGGSACGKHAPLDRRAHHHRHRPAEGSMDIFDSRYFAVNKWMLRAMGLWPFEQARSKYSRRLLVSLAIIGTGLPHLAGMVVNRGKERRVLLEHIGTLMIVSVFTVSFVSSIVYEDKLRRLYQAIASNWAAIVEPREARILQAYSQMGRLITLGWIAYVVCAATTFALLPLSPMLLDVLKPLNASRPRQYILNGEFLVDREANYGRIYAYDLLSTVAMGFIIVVCDSMYAVCVEHCLGLFAIISHRLQRPADDECAGGDAAYQQMLRVIRLHTRVLHFTDVLESTYERPFFLMISINLIYTSLLCVMTLMQDDNLFDLARYVLLCAGASIHLFYVSWPGQKLIDHSSALHGHAYLTQWYDSSARAKVLLSVFMQRCSKPCLLTAGGLYTMNFENFAKIMKKSVSFMAVFSSF